MNTDRAKLVLDESGIDVLLVARLENVRYLTELPLDLPQSLGLPLAATLRRDPFGTADIVAPRVMAGSIPATTMAASAIRLYGRFFASSGHQPVHEDAERRAITLLDSAPGDGQTFEETVRSLVAGIERSAKVAWDDPRLGAAMADAGRSPSADGDALIRRIRQVKTPDEVERIRHAAEIAEGVELDIMGASVVGADWADVVNGVPHWVTGRGGTPGYFTGGAAWQGGFMFEPQHLTLSRGDMIRLDVGLAYEGYWADTGRSVSLGEPSAEAIRRYAAIRSGVEAALEAIRPGTTFAALYERAMSTVLRSIPEFRRHHCGHAIGLRAYEGSLVAPGDDLPLEVGMTLNIEVPYYEIGWGGLQLEETVVVEPDGYRALTTLGRDIFVLPA
jgi:Xaa-Pro aminopeptidase